VVLKVSLTNVISEEERCPQSTTMVLGLLATIGKQVRALFKSDYRPERHYMRGPGPKSRQADRLRAASAAHPLSLTERLRR
jgi:hypothetical protein